MENSKSKHALDLLKNIIQQEHKNLNRTFVSRTNFLNSSAIKLLAPIRNSLIPNQNISYLIKNLNQYHPSHQEKGFALNYLLYVLNHNPVIPYHLFPKKDHSLITKFLKNQFLLALFDNINTEKLFYPKPKIKPNHGLNLLKNKNLKNACILDCGAFIGNTVLFFKKTLSPQKIVALEPDPVNFKNLKQTIKTNNLSHVLAIQTAVGSSKKTASLSLSGTAGAHLSPAKPNQPPIPVNTIDHLVKKHRLQNIKLIKMDIEGWELKALKGAKKTIKKYQPALIISIYHQGQDLFKIPFFLLKLNPHYQFRFANINPKSPTIDKIIIAQ